MSDEKRRLSPEEIKDEIHELARTGDDANKRWALKILASEDSTSLALPEPFGVHEVAERLARINRAVGMSIAKMGWNLAFIATKQSPTDRIGEAIGEDIIKPEVMAKIKSLRTVKHLYVFAPILKKPGVPKGFPTNSGKEAQAKWVIQQATKVVIERIKSHLDQMTGEPLAANDSGEVTAVQNVGD